MLKFARTLTATLLFGSPPCLLGQPLLDGSALGTNIQNAVELTAEEGKVGAIRILSLFPSARTTNTLLRLVANDNSQVRREAVRAFEGQRESLKRCIDRIETEIDSWPGDIPAEALPRFKAEISDLQDLVEAIYSVQQFRSELEPVVYGTKVSDERLVIPAINRLAAQSAELDAIPIPPDEDEHYSTTLCGFGNMDYECASGACKYVVEQNPAFALRILKSSSTEFQAVLVTALASANVKGAFPELLKLRNSEFASVRASVLASLANYPGHSSNRALLEGLHDPVPGVRSAACDSLGSLHDAAATNQLLVALTDSSRGVRYAARSALLVIDPDRLAKELFRLMATGAFPYVEDAFEDLAAVAGEKSIALLSNYANGHNPDVAEKAVGAIATLKSDAAANILIPLLRNSSADLAKTAIVALGEMGSFMALSELRLLANSGPLDLRIAAQEAIDRILEPKPTPPPNVGGPATLLVSKVSHVSTGRNQRGNERDSRASTCNRPAKFNAVQ